MSDYVQRHGLMVAPQLVDFIEQQVLPDCSLTSDQFWSGTAAIFARFAPENAALLAKRDALQAQIDTFYKGTAGKAADGATTAAFLRDIGYLVPEPAPFTITTAQVDPEISTMAGPQLVVPILNARFLLNAANARWGSLYDALYGTDVMEGSPQAGGYDAARGAAVIARARAFLDQAVPLAQGSWSDFAGGVPLLVHPEKYLGYQGDPAQPTALLLRNNGLHIQILIDPTHPIGKTDKAGIADIVVESALTTIVDLEDSIAAVDANDKVAAYSNWLGLMRGDLMARFDKGGQSHNRSLEHDQMFTAPNGDSIPLKGRSLLLIRNVGHLMTNPAIRLADGHDAPEGILDAIISSLIATIDITGKGRFTNSRTRSIYIVKPKMHGPEEAAFTDALFNAVEDLLGLVRYTIKVGVMDEERRTSANLAACIHAVKGRIVFINTGFLDRTGDEIHTAMHAGAMIPKAEMKTSAWITAYEARNVQIGLACGLSGRAQIGKGMWAAPDRMGDMMAQKIAHPLAGANTAWVPSPTAATLHALHYHQVDVFARQAELAQEPIAPIEKLLTIPLAKDSHWSAETIAHELDNNTQGILGYVVRWIDQGIGCSKVPDINDIGLMEDRATLRISSQHMANWLLHGVCSKADIDAAFARMAIKVDAQNAGDPLYQPMAGHAETSIAFQAAYALVMQGVDQPNGYTEPLLHAYRLRKKG